MFSPDDFRALVDVGFIALSRGLNKEAMRIFDAARLVRPGSEAGHIGAALTLLSQGDAKAAVAQLKALPPTNAARVFLGMALLRLGEREHGIEVLDDVAGYAPDTPAGRLARSLLSAAPAGGLWPLH